MIDSKVISMSVVYGLMIVYSKMSNILNCVFVIVLNVKGSPDIC